MRRKKPEPCFKVGDYIISSNGLRRKILKVDICASTTKYGKIEYHYVDIDTWVHGVCTQGKMKIWGKKADLLTSKGIEEEDTHKVSRMLNGDPYFT